MQWLWTYESEMVELKALFRPRIKETFFISRYSPGLAHDYLQRNSLQEPSSLSIVNKPDVEHQEFQR